MGAPQLAIQFYGIVLHKNNVGLGEREAVAQEVLLKDSFFGILAKDFLFGPLVDPLAEIQGPPISFTYMHLHTLLCNGKTVHLE